MKKTFWIILLSGLVCCCIMALVDGVLQPGYAVKSGIKASMFLLVPFFLSRRNRQLRFGSLFRLEKASLKTAFSLGFLLFAVILAAYFILRNVIDFSAIAGSLTENAGVTKENFLFVSLYISFANSLLEEFFFRGFLFWNLKSEGGRTLAYGCSAILFALYHVAMMVGWFSAWLMFLVLAALAVGGMIFNRLNERWETIYVSWVVHMFANFAINTVGFILLQA